jgi:small subunit ribosomal protein S20
VFVTHGKLIATSLLGISSLMAHSLSAKKRIRQNAKTNARNRWRLKIMREAIKDFNEKLLHGSVADAKASFAKLSQILDRTAAKGIIHKNNAARRKGRLSARLKKKAAK